MSILTNKLLARFMAFFLASVMLFSTMGGAGFSFGDSLQGNILSSIADDGDSGGGNPPNPPVSLNPDDEDLSGQNDAFSGNPIGETNNTSGETQFLPSSYSDDIIAPFNTYDPGVSGHSERRLICLCWFKVSTPAPHTRTGDN